MTASTYQYVGLPDAQVVTTRALLTARENIMDTVAARAMMCIHGGAGFGKTLAVNTCLHELEDTRGEEVCRVTFRARPTARAVRYELFDALNLAGEPPRHPSEFDRLLENSPGRAAPYFPRGRGAVAERGGVWMTGLFVRWGLLFCSCLVDGFGGTGVVQVPP